MRVTKIKIENFRLLKNITVDIEKNLSLIIGKNNCGKTSFLLCLEKFIGGSATKNQFTFEDLNSDIKDLLLKVIDGTIPNDQQVAISLKIFIKYDETDDLEHIGDKVIMDLDPNNQYIVLAFEYRATQEDIQRLATDFHNIKAKK